MREVVELAAFFAFGPQIGPPEQEGRLIERQFRVAAFHLALDQPAGREGAFVGVGLGIQAAFGISAPDVVTFYKIASYQLIP